MSALELLQDVRARLSRITEALEDGEDELAYQISVELEVDLASWFMATRGAQA